MILIAAILEALAWVLYDFGILNLENRNLNLWLGLVAFSFVMAVGLSWLIVRRQIIGQLDVDETDD